MTTILNMMANIGI